MSGLGFSLDNWVELGWIWVISALLNGLLGFKGPTHLMPTQTYPFDTPSEETVKRPIKPI